MDSVSTTNRVKFNPIDRIIAAPDNKIVDQCYDQGYGSERSPEDEMPPPLPIIDTAHYNSILMNPNCPPDTAAFYYGQSDPRMPQQMQQAHEFITEGKHTFLTKWIII